jgi:putative ABC transport system permease protein
VTPERPPGTGGGVGLRLFLLLLLLYPRHFRRAYREQLVEAYLLQRDEALHRGHPGTLRFAWEILTDTIVSAVRRHLAAVRRRSIHNRQSPISTSSLSGVAIMTSTFLQDIRYALRNLAKSPGFSVLVVLILAVGIGANVAMFSMMNQALVRPLPYADPDHLVLGRATFNSNLNPLASAYDYYDYRERNSVFESLAAILFSTIDMTVTGGDEPERVAGTFASWDLFRALGVDPAVGRHFSREEGEPGGPSVVILSNGYWQRRFGSSSDAIGQTITVNGTSQTIVGVMPADFQFMHRADVWLPMRKDGPMANARRWHNWFLVGRLNAGIDLDQAQAEMDVISAQLASEYPETNRDKALLLTGLHETLVEEYRTSLFLLTTAVGLVLLIACGNVASLLLARGSNRRSEMSIRAALGASASRLTRLLLTESLVTALAAGVLGIGLAFGFQKLILQFLPLDLPGMDALGLSGSMLSFAVVLSAVTGLVFGILPAARAARPNVVEDIKSGARATDSRGSQFRSALVVVQVAISVVLLVGSGLLIRSFASLRRVDPGFEARSLLTAEIRLAQAEYAESEVRINFYSKLAADVAAIPGVTDVALINQLPIRDPGNNIYVYAADNPPADPNDRDVAFQRVVFPGYFQAMGIPLLQGRDIDRSDTEGTPPVLVINETMARTLFPDQNPLGRHVAVDVGEEMTAEVIGVVGDVRMSAPRYDPRLAMYGSYFQQPYYRMRLAIRTVTDPASIAPQLRAAVWSQDRDIPVADLSTMSELISRSVSSDRVMAVSLSLFAAVAMSLAAIGLYGLLAYYVSKRIHEIGVRVALGAGSGDIVKLVVNRGLKLVVAGIVAGLVAAFWSTRLIQQMLFNVEATDPATFGAVCVFFGTVALIACLIPAWRALRVDPLLALQAE